MKNTLTYPSYSGWITARTDDIQLTTDNMLLILPKPIADLSHVWLKAENSAKVGISYKTEETEPVTTQVSLSEIQTKDTSGVYHNIAALDLKQYILEYDEYRTLGTQSVFEWQTSNRTKNNTSYYTRYGKEIKLCTAEASWGTFAPILNSIRSLLNDRREKGETFYYGGYPILVFGNVTQDTSMLLWQWRVEYEPLGENIKLNVPKTNAEEIPFAIPYNQQQQIASSVGLGRNMQSTANRTGTEQKQVVRYITKLSQMRRVGEVGTLNGELWRLTEVTATFAPKRARLTETWTKGWSNRSQYVGVNREFRSWNIPSEITERNLLYQDYCLITRKSGLNLSGAKIGTTAHNLLMYFIDSKKSVSVLNAYEQSAMWLMRDNTNGVVLSASAFGFGNSLVFSARTKDNLSAGTKRIKIADNDSNYQQNVDVYYCNEDGTLEKMYVDFASDIAYMDSNAYPESKSGETNTPSTYRLFNRWVEFAVDKDEGEQLNFAYQLHLLTDDPNLIIGSTWAGRNYLVHQYDSVPTRKYWNITKRLPQGAQTMTSAFGVSGQSSSVCTVTAQTSGETIAFTVPSGSLGVCVTDENNNILVAWQGGANATFTTYYTHDYGAIKKAVKS